MTRSSSFYSSSPIVQYLIIIIIIVIICNTINLKVVEYVINSITDTTFIIIIYSNTIIMIINTPTNKFGMIIKIISLGLKKKVVCFL